MHDLRTKHGEPYGAARGRLPTIEKLLNHTGGSFAGIVAVYQRHDFADEKRQALEVWAQHLLTFAEVERGPEPDRRPADVAWA